MTDHDFYGTAMSYPEWVVLDIPDVVRDYQAYFRGMAEYALFLAFQTVMDLSQYRNGMHSLRRGANHLLNRLIAELEAQQDLEYDADGFAMDMNKMFAEHMLVYEKGVATIRQRLIDLKLYVFDRYLPYEFQSLVPDGLGHVLLQRVTNFQYWLDLVAE